MAIEILHVFSSFAVGGSQMRFAQLANGLKGEFRHRVIALDGQNGAMEKIFPGTPVELVKAPEMACALPGRLMRIRRFVKQNSPDLMATYNWGAIEWALANRLLPRVPHLHFEDGFGPDEDEHRQIPRRVLVRRVALSGGHTRVIVPSQALFRLASEGQWHLTTKRVKHIVNGVDIDKFSPDPMALPRDYVHVVTVGALRAEKNFSRLIEAIAAVRDMTGKDVRLSIAGDGPDRPRLEAEIERLELAGIVLLLGAVRAPETVLKSGDIFAMSSTTEQMPISLLEAMAVGLPAVCTDVGDIRSMLSVANTSFVTPEPDKAAYHKALATLIEDKTFRQEMGAANRARVEMDFDEQGMLNTYRTLFTKMAAKRNGTLQ